MSFLKKIQDESKSFQSKIADKLDNGLHLNDLEVDSYELRDEDVEVMGYLNKVLNGEHVPGFSVKDFLASPQAKVLIPKIVIGAAVKSAEPMYLASKFFKKVRLKNGSAVQFPQFGVIRAYDVAEGQEIQAENLDWNLYSDSRINVGKVGLRIQYTDEIIEETEFDIIGTLTSEAGRALGRHKEQKAFTVKYVI